MANNLESFLQSFSNVEESKKEEESPRNQKVLQNKKRSLNVKINEKQNLVKEKTNKNNIVNDNKEHLYKVDELFNKTGTDIKMKDIWIETYKKGLKSVKKNQTVMKIREGRFRIKSNGAIEMLPDLKVETMTITKIFNEKWIKGER